MAHRDIVTTSATRDLCSIMLRDGFQEVGRGYLNKRRRDDLPPLGHVYTMATPGQPEAVHRHQLRAPLSGRAGHHHLLRCRARVGVGPGRLDVDDAGTGQPARRLHR
jgi:hypothetical protein